MDRIKMLELYANRIRTDVINISKNSKKTGTHVGGALSIADLLAVLYGSVMRYDITNPYDEDRDRLILSKGHAAIALYSALSHAGFISREELENAFLPNASLFKHPKRNILKGIECSSGSLGMGLSFAMGVGRALILKGNTSSRVFTVLGDGECDEGSVYEAACSIVHYNLKNVIPIIDGNKLQLDGTNDDVNRKNIPERFKSIGFDVIEIDGHDIVALDKELSKNRNVPTAIYLNTIKGKGVSFIENRVEWHMGILTSEQRELALEELKLHD